MTNGIIHNTHKEHIITAPRSTKLEHKYQRRGRKERAIAVDMCPFCEIKAGDSQLVEETSAFKVILNTAPYSLWDGQGVKDHLMIVPKHHTERLGDLDDKSAVEFLGLVSKYEELGYNLFARAPMTTTKSVAHQHTHLILPTDDHKNFVLYFRKPFYVRLSR